LRGTGRHFRFDDGGRAAAGYRGKAGDCVVRAIAIAAGRDYQEIYERVNGAAMHERTGKRKRGISNARTGVYRTSIKRVMKSLGWVWTPTMQIGSGCTVHLRAEELPAGRLVVSVSKHLTAVIDGVIHDTHDCSRRGTRCVYGYWQAPESGRGRMMGGNQAKKNVHSNDAVRKTLQAKAPPFKTESEALRPRPGLPPRPGTPPWPRRRKTLWEWLFG
jgi:hypothetical protein